MKPSRTCSMVSLACFAVLFSGCSDLKIRKLSLSPTCPTTKTEIIFTAEVENTGPLSAPTSTLAFEVGGEKVPRFYKIPGLASGATFTVQRKSVLDIAQKYQNTVTVDVNKSVMESHENNNQATQSYFVAQAPDTSGLKTFIYYEALPAIARGVLIDETAARNLNVKPGYYQIGEYGAGNWPGEKARVLNIEKNYPETAEGQSVFPMRSQPWVFSLIDKDGWISDRRQAFAGRDYYGHTFTYEIEWVPASNCWKVVKAALDCAKVGLSTQSYTFRQLNTCSWSSEPPWTNP